MGRRFLLYLARAFVARIHRVWKKMKTHTKRRRIVLLEDNKYQNRINWFKYHSLVVF